MTDRQQTILQRMFRESSRLLLWAGRQSFVRRGVSAPVQACEPHRLRSNGHSTGKLVMLLVQESRARTNSENRSGIMIRVVPYLAWPTWLQMLVMVPNVLLVGVRPLGTVA